MFATQFGMVVTYITLGKREGPTLSGNTSRVCILLLDIVLLRAVTIPWRLLRVKSGHTTFLSQQVQTNFCMNLLTTCCLLRQAQCNLIFLQSISTLDLFVEHMSSTKRLFYKTHTRKKTCFIREAPWISLDEEESRPLWRAHQNPKVQIQHESNGGEIHIENYQVPATC